MDLAVQLLPEKPSAKALEVPPEALLALRSGFRVLLDDMRRARPEPGSESEKSFLVRFSLFGLESIRLLGIDYVDLMRLACIRRSASCSQGA